jgi:hypothetical protein
VFGGPIGAILGNKGGDALNAMTHPPKTPDLNAPNALSATPTQASAARTASQQTLDNEANQASTGSMLTGGAGLLDQPTTTSKTLLGS